MTDATRLLRIGVAAAVLLGVGLSLLVALTTPPFASIDENAHTSYALQVASGHLPTMRTPTTPMLPGMVRQPTYVANHPPAYYAFVGIPARLGSALGHPMAGFFLARVLTAALLGVALFAVAWCALALAPRDPHLAVAAPALLGLLPLLSAVSGQVLNDAAALASSALTLAVAVVVIRRGLTVRRLAALCLAAAVAALCRGSGLTVTVVAALAAAVAARQTAAVGKMRSVPIVARPALAAACVVSSVVVASGWFYLRNRHLYGDIFGSQVSLAMFPSRHVPRSEFLTSGHLWLGVYRGLFGRPQYLVGTAATVVRVVRWAIGIGLVVTVVQLFRRRQRPSSRTMWALSLLALQALLTLAAFVSYAHRGGALFPRYLLPAALPVAMLAALALGALSPRRRIPTMAAVVALTGLAVWLNSANLSWHHPDLAHLGTLQRDVTSLRNNGFPLPGLVLAALLALIVVAVLGVLVSLWLPLDSPRTATPDAEADVSPGPDAPELPCRPRRSDSDAPEPLH